MSQDIIRQRCGSINDYHTTPAGPHIKAICNGCNRYIKFVPKDAAAPKRETTADSYRKPLTYEFLDEMGLELEDDNLYINPAMRMCYDGKVWRVEFKEDGNWNWYSSVGTQGQFLILIAVLAPDLVKKQAA